MCSSRQIRWREKAAFTLIELLVATAVLLVVMLVLLQLTGGVGEIWKSSRGKISAFQNARSAFSTLSRTLSRATLNTYNDYVDASENYRTQANSGTFAPTKFMRASELQFISGPTVQILPNTSALKNPGDAVFFQAPLGDTDENGLKSLNRTVNSTGFYIQYGPVDDSLLPEWLKQVSGSTKRFRLVQVVEPTEDLKIYTSTSGSNGYDLDWLQAFGGTTAGSPRARVLAEDIPLLIIRPRLTPQDESTVAPLVGMTFGDSTQGSILSPNFHYDSRAWEAGYPASQRVKATTSFAARVNIMRNQVPPILDVAMVSVDRMSLARFDQTSDTPPVPLQVPSDLFVDSSRFEEDLDKYGKQLSDAGIRYRVFRTAVEIQGAKWSNN